MTTITLKCRKLDVPCDPPNADLRAKRAVWIARKHPKRWQCYSPAYWRGYWSRPIKIW